MAEIEGKIILIQDVKQGTSKQGKDWIKQDFVLETEEQYPRRVHIQCFGDNLVDQLSFYKIGYNIKVKYNLESREHNGNWFTSINAWNLSGLVRSTQNAENAKDDPFHPDNDPAFTPDLPTDDLPF